ncbi:signal recognition particle receptor beta subunit-domain-containing protein [Panaeolus papilionaceus]|nr:signal recognition particle receptor beta subunit-domain-containing protein [Panaeolus papilionaceus]
MENLNDKMPHETPEVLPVAAGFSPSMLVVGSLGVALLLFLVLLITNRRKASSRGNALLLVGAPDAGKTALLSQLSYGKSLPTQTSMQMNSSSVVLSPQRSMRVIDIPGHPRLRTQFHEHLSEARAIAFVVDASSISRNGAAVAEHLHHVLHALTSLPPSQHQPELLILAHKADLLKSSSTSSTSSNALAINRVKTVLERELEKRRVAQSGGINIEGLGEEGERSEMGGLDCGEKVGSMFKFDEWDGGEVTFLATSISVGPNSETNEKDGDSGLQSLWETLEQL